MFTAEHMLELLMLGWLATVPLAIGSILTLSIFFERLWSLRGLESRSRDLSQKVIDKLVERDLDGARELCKTSNAPVAEIFLEALRWRNVAIEDLERVMATSRAEIAASLRRGIWIIGTVGSLAPFVGLFGTVVGIIRAFADMAVHGSGGFAVVANGIAEALIATALGLGVAVVALLFYNYLQTRIQRLTATYARASEHFCHALLYLETSAEAESREVPHGRLSPA
jgi:biopolymer transport protein ExbB